MPQDFLVQGRQVQHNHFHSLFLSELINIAFSALGRGPKGRAAIILERLRNAHLAAVLTCHSLKPVFLSGLPIFPLSDFSAPKAQLQSNLEFPRNCVGYVLSLTYFRCKLFVVIFTAHLLHEWFLHMKAALVYILWKTYITGKAWDFRPNYLLSL